MTTIAFTGHRSDKIGGWKLPNPTYISICQQTEKLLLDLKPEKCISGMALGFDSYSASVCIKLGIPFIAAVPCDNQDKMWPEHSKKTYKLLLSKASEIVIVSPGEYKVEKMMIRNKWMVDHSNLLLACFDGSNGGTKNCVDYAKSINKEIIYLDLNVTNKNM